MNDVLNKAVVAQFIGPLMDRIDGAVQESDHQDGGHIPPKRFFGEELTERVSAGCVVEVIQAES